MTHLTQFRLALIVAWLPLIFGIPFVKDSFTMCGREGSNAFIREYSIEGVQLQQINFPASPLYNGFVPRVDSTRTILAALLFVPAGLGGVNNYVYTYNAQGDKIDETIVPTSNTATDMVIEGQDVWALYAGKIAYTTRGATSTANQDITSGASSITQIQLVSGRLYVADNGVLKYMDPIITTGSSTLTTVTGLSILCNYFYFPSPFVVYVSSGSVVAKYTLNAGQATEAYRVTPNTGGRGIKGLYAMDVGGVRYVMVLTKDSISASSSLLRLTDDSTAFIDPKTIADESYTFHGVGPSPQGTCSDGFKNQDETDIDCGGATCSKCANDKTCAVDGDCTSGYCPSVAKTCASPLCNDTVLNGKETDVDCGGPECTGCAISQTCKGNEDCLGNACNNVGLCVASCTDGILNNGESDIDCGGVNCDPCSDGKSCELNTDCSSEYCNPNSKCSVPSCSDGFSNQGETDVDCGGGTCNPCDNGNNCFKNMDCTSNLCSNNVCVNPPPVASPVATPVTAPVDAPVDPPMDVPVNAPIDGPASNQTPKSSTPLSAPVKQKGVSTGAVFEKSIVGLLVGLAALLMF